MTARAPVLAVTAQRLGVEALRLGTVCVGYVHEGGAAGRPRYSWTVALSDWPRRTGPAGSARQARDQVRQVVEEWLTAAGIIDVGDVIEMRVDGRLEAAEPERARA
ncbi:hypothetical protein RA307_31740 [Xanthobacteraceae bacterium Astr-EGSB]|uniref:hypothetical protein n=1 Tax=Astrobacterium formosum TaxID=3069710 RepID=UPI0027ADB902|nr:hypothetical protein [Xanthobacteraceae bacterium Astr-EGSB]